jgi:V8-like Glu-specific endopeptidase
MVSSAGKARSAAARQKIPEALSGFRRALRTGNPIPSTDAAAAALENSGGAEADLSDAGIKNRLDVAREQLRKVVEQHLGGDQALLDIVDEITRGGDEALRRLAGDDAEAFSADGALLADLETIVRLDGSRPSFMVRNGDVDLTTSPVGGWADVIEASRPALRQTLACVGRINLPGTPEGFEGTGFLVQRNFVLTNRHVLQSVADNLPEGWSFRSGACIDFGHEFRSSKRHPRRALKRVVFCGPEAIEFEKPVDHRKLDLALIELEASLTDDDVPETLLSVDLSSDWAQEGTYVFVAGYPAPPPFGRFTPTLIEKLFQGTFGCKRLAPGAAAKSLVEVPAWTMAHDVTTLGGNSGSVLVVAGRETAAAALHYGGKSRPPRENWAHVLGATLDMRAEAGGQTLRECLTSLNVDLIDRRVGAEEPGPKAET